MLTLTQIFESFIQKIISLLSSNFQDIQNLKLEISIFGKKYTFYAESISSVILFGSEDIKFTRSYTIAYNLISHIVNCWRRLNKSRRNKFLKFFN